MEEAEVKALPCCLTFPSALEATHVMDSSESKP